MLPRTAELSLGKGRQSCSHFPLLHAGNYWPLSCLPPLSSYPFSCLLLSLKQKAQRCSKNSIPTSEEEPWAQGRNYRQYCRNAHLKTSSHCPRHQFIGDESHIHLPPSLCCSRKPSWHNPWHRQAANMEVLLGWGTELNKRSNKRLFY